MDSWEDDSSSLSEWVSESGSGVRVLQRRGLSRGGLGGWEMVGVRRLYLIVGLEEARLLLHLARVGTSVDSKASLTEDEAVSEESDTKGYAA